MHATVRLVAVATAWIRPRSGCVEEGAWWQGPRHVLSSGTCTLAEAYTAAVVRLHRQGLFCFASTFGCFRFAMARLFSTFHPRTCPHPTNAWIPSIPTVPSPLVVYRCVLVPNRPGSPHTCKEGSPGSLFSPFRTCRSALDDAKASESVDRSACFPSHQPRYPWT